VEDSADGLKLNLGCGDIRWEGWTGVDIEKGDLQCDLRRLELPDDCANVAIAVHVIEHFYQWEVQPLLAEWKRVLVPGGKLILELPCMDKVLNYLRHCMELNLPIAPSMGWFVFWGDPRYQDPLMSHKWGYTKEMIREELEQAGFSHIEFTKSRYHFEMRDMRIEAIK
jgi:ubiquinone/menaquinone biosynthesis C-methylase UbiE